MKKTCSVDGCHNFVHGKGYCNKHRIQIQRYGHIFERTKFDAPNIRIDGDIAYLTLYDKRENTVAEAIIDSEDISQVSMHKWYLHNQGYVGSKTAKLLHRFVMKATSGQMIDHINKNKLDNRKENLRITSRSVNVHNSKMHITNTSGTKGVCFHRGTEKWEAFISIDGKRTRKLFETVEDAIAFRKEMEMKL